MRNLLTGFTVAAVLACAGVSQAANGLVDMSWDACTPVVLDKTSSAQVTQSMFVSVIGFDLPHQGYETTFIYADGSGSVPDAWRFDPLGCQGTPYYSIDYLSLAKTCPSFQGGLASVQVRDVGFVPSTDPGRYSQSYMRVSLFNVYPPGIPSTSLTTRYFLMGVNFNHLYSVAGAGTPGSTCGGYEAPICFKMARANYLDMSGAELPFGRNVAPGAPLYVTFNGGAACGAVPAKAATWGAIKNQYRN